ncbi:MAG: 2-oxoacid:acceptor oxidoreductase subunit alpha [Firmicutes bacterium]|nr:2-oxoacid:acceptor oxidoreductase subunit alpha [Candidatus Fermentithermobacillaceae bacterium]HON87438.1 2-oxoacid:acceptor oxidoreductase subunit alpha [Bacillota bacterium]HOV65656.1 2-oxoacid:acceptor oxidoreductase subunit alpha [Bacillota bacterium]HRC53067.1 2-oxoacid:acceptor oxidoreductase subunit alpha [Bacillota bacterium]
MKKGSQLLQGNEACVEGAIAAGLRFFAGYPITPSTEIAELCAARLPQVGGRFMQMEDEIASMAAVCGASLAGLKAMTATSGPGFSLKQENLGFAIEGEIPCVVVDVQRVGPSTGMPTSAAQGDVMQARWGVHGDHEIVALSPSSVEETYTLAVEAFNIAEELRTPVILLMDEMIGHLREKVSLPDKSDLVIKNREKPTVPPEQYKPFALNEGKIPGVPPLAAYGDGYRFHVTGLTHGEDGFPTNNPLVGEKQILRINEKIRQRKGELCKVEEFYLDDAEIVVFAYGGTARSAKKAVKDARAQGIKAGLLRAITIWPFVEDAVLKVKGMAPKAIIVPEMNLGQLVLPVKRVIGDSCPVVSINKVAGQLIEPDEILKVMKEAM